MEAKPVLHYFKYFGRAEPIRFALMYFGIDFNENELKHEHSDGEEGAKEWKEKRKEFQFEAVPVLEIDGKKLSQSKAILRYIFMRQNQYPTDPYEIYRVESLVDLFLDIMDALEKAFVSGGEEAAFVWVKANLAKKLEQLQKRLEANSTQDFLVGDKLSMADVVFGDLKFTSFRGATEEWKKVLDEIFAPFDKLNAYFAKRKPDFQKRLDTRPDYFM